MYYLAFVKKENGLKLILNRLTTLYFQVRGTLDIRSLAVMDNQMKVNRIKNFLGKSISLRRQRGRVVRASDLKSVGGGFKSRSDH